VSVSTSGDLALTDAKVLLIDVVILPAGAIFPVFRYMSPDQVFFFSLLLTRESYFHALSLSGVSLGVVIAPLLVISFFFFS